MSHFGVSHFTGISLGLSQTGVCEEGSHITGVTTDLLTVSFASGGLEGALDLLYEAHGQRGPTVGPLGCHLRKGQWEEGEDEGALMFVLTLSYTHYTFGGGGGGSKGQS